MVSAATFGLREEAFDLRLQYRRKSSRCQRRRVSGWTMKSVCFQARTVLAKSTRRMRSFFVHAGRFTCRLRMMSCCRKSAFSAYALRLASGKICQCSQGQGGSEWFCPMNTASTEYVHRRTNEPLETGMNRVQKCASPSEGYVD
jgi:hypothetical protein